MDAKEMNARVADIASRGGGGNHKDTFLSRMAAGKAKAAASRASSTAPPSAPPKPKGGAVPQKAKAAGNTPATAKMPAPAKPRAVGRGMNITINVTSKG